MSPLGFSWENMADRFQFQKPDRYQRGVLLGNWFEDRCKYHKTPHEYKSLYSIDYVPKPRSANDKSLVWDQNLRAQGYGPRLIFDHQAPHFLENYSSTYDLSYNHLPKLAPDGPKHRHFRSRMLTFEPQQDYAQNYGNITGYGLVEYQKQKWQTENPVPRVTLTTHYQDTFLPPSRSDLVTEHFAIPIKNSSYMDSGNKQSVHLRLRNKPLFRVPENDLVVVPPREVRCNPVIWDCPDKYKEFPDRCVET